MTCTACGKKTENPMTGVALWIGGVVGGGIAVETAILAGMLFTPLFIMGALVVTTQLYLSKDTCQCHA